MKKYYILFTLLIVAVVAFKDKEPATDILPDNIMVNGKLFTSLFQQNSAEYKALCFQAYTLARLQVDLAVKQPSSRPRAIITDIDETVLDNSPYAVHQALKGKNYDGTSWAEWTARAEADTLAGALSFFNYAASKGIEVFYISNRDEKERKGTLENLKHYNFPCADDNHLILKQLTSSKEERRQKVTATHDIVLFLGDNLADFSVIYDKKSSEERLLATQQLSAEFGKKFIVLPNANYGDWESALFKYNYKLSAKQKDSVIINCLKNY